MGDWPSVASMRVAGEAITPWHDLSVGSLLEHIMVSAGITSTAWPLANRAIFVPFRLDRPYLITQAVVGCGATGGNNFDVGIYDFAGNKIVTSGATARAAAAEVVANLTDTMIGPGVYYMALASDSVSTFIAASPAQAGLVKACGIKQMAAAYVLPATVTFATAASAYVPVFGLWGTAK